MFEQKQAAALNMLFCLSVYKADKTFFLLAEMWSYRPLANVPCPWDTRDGKHDTTDPTSHIMETVCRVPGTAILILLALLISLTILWGQLKSSVLPEERGRRVVWNTPVFFAEEAKHRQSKRHTGKWWRKQGWQNHIEIVEKGQTQSVTAMAQNSTATLAIEAQDYKNPYKIKSSHFFPLYFSQQTFSPVTATIKLASPQCKLLYSSSSGQRIHSSPSSEAYFCFYLSFSNHRFTQVWPLILIFPSCTPLAILSQSSIISSLKNIKKLKKDVPGFDYPIPI